MTSNLNGFEITLPAIILEKMTQDKQVRCITIYFEVLLGYNGSAAFGTLQAPIPHITVCYICIQKLITLVTLLHLITPQ